MSAEERLARRLYERMEHLDPSLEEVAWDDLLAREKDLYILCVRSLFQERSLVKEYISDLGWDRSARPDAREAPVQTQTIPGYGTVAVVYDAPIPLRSR